MSFKKENVNFEDKDARIYPCADCGKMRSKNEGGTVFTVCDECWDKHFSKEDPRADPCNRPENIR